MRSSIRFTHAVPLVLAMLSGPVVAAQFDYTLYAGVEHSNNINLSASAPVSQWVLTPGFGFNYAQQGAVLQANVTGTAEYFDYLGGSYSNHVFGNLAGRMNWMVLPKRLDFVVQDYASVQPISSLYSDAPNNQQQTNAFSAGPTLYFNLGSAIRGQMDLRYINSRASRTTTFDSSRGEAALRIFRDVSPTSHLSLNLETQKVNFDASSETDYHRDEAFVRYVSKLARLDLDVAAGWSRIRLDSSTGSATSPLVRIDIGWNADSRNVFAVSYERSYSDATQDLIHLARPMESGTRATIPLDIQTGGVVMGGGIYLERRAQASYSYRGERFTASLSPWYRKLHYVEGVQPDETGHGADIEVDYRLSPRLTLSGFANYEREHYTTLARRDVTRNAGLALRQSINQHWSWRASLTDRRRTSTSLDSAYRAKEIYLGVVYRR